MNYEAFNLQGFNKENPWLSSSMALGDKTFNLEVRWDFLFNFGYIIIRDENNDVIVGATALVNNLIIKTDQRKLPGYLKFVHKNGETYEPEINNIAEDFIFYYVNE